MPLLFDATDGSTDYLHTPIPPNPVLDANSAAVIQAANLGSNLPGVAGDEWAIPIYVTHDSDPSYAPVFSQTTWGCSVGGGMHIPDGATRETPDATAGGDAWILTVNLDDGATRAIWQASLSSGTWNGSCGGEFPLHGNGFNATAGLGNGAGAQIGAGMVLFSELASGQINHALYTASTITCDTFRPPATKSDGTHSTSCFPEGARLQLDPSVDCATLSGATPGEIAVCQAVQTYGLYVLDSGGGEPVDGVSAQGDDLTDPNRVPWQTPGNGFRGSRGCSPVSATCGQLAAVGFIGTGDLVHIPWTQLRMLANWNGQ